MAVTYKDLHEFVRRLEREGELKRISVEADVDLEITEITDRRIQGGGAGALIREAVPGKERCGLLYATAHQYAGVQEENGAGAGG